MFEQLFWQNAMTESRYREATLRVLFTVVRGSATERGRQEAGTGPRSDGPDGLTRCPTNGPGDVRPSRKTPPDRSGGVSYTAAFVYRTGNSVTRRVVQP